MPIKVTLGGADYSVPKMNIGQIEDFTAISRGDPKWASKSLQILLSRADPKVADVREMEATPEEVRTAIDEILIASGWKKAEEQSPNPAAPETNPGQANS